MNSAALQLRLEEACGGLKDGDQKDLGFRVEGLVFRVWGLGFRV